MDSDCLIKLTKAGLKEPVVDFFKVSIPQAVELEVVTAGLIKQKPDALVVRENIKQKKLKVFKSQKKFKSGDVALVELFDHKKFDCVATDDAKLIKFLKSKGIPFILPALILYQLYRNDAFCKETFKDSLEKLKKWISLEEYSTVKLLLKGDLL
ncbi:MAG: hypothetical protein H7A33_00015 [Deltaproteobacteria bacterium]|nr:hypothetical protein [Deltaproteobacteria bacterium]